MREPRDVVWRAFGFGKVVVEMGTVGPILGDPTFAPGVVDQRHQIAQAEQGDGIQPADPGRIVVVGRPFFVEPHEKFPPPIALDAALPCQESRRAEQARDGRIRRSNARRSARTGHRHRHGTRR
ncbi:hypothetical protein [Bradyrhizobium sp.]|uniref:hypothetical protein n=1 Tax=Bradyrhizobium sp. TaxID=376 RepID=UPI0025C6E75D|nr:hypothetical protein [Bradyrhizobium sp.]